MTKKTVASPQTKIEREQALDRDRRAVLGALPEKALDLIADHPYPVTLVQSMAEEDLYHLIHAIGLDDAVPVIALASNRQWEYLLDMETWARDTVDTDAMSSWLSRLLKADPDRFTHWITKDKRDDFVFYLYRNIQLHIREYDQDPGEIPEDFFSEDQTYYLRLKPFAAEHQKQQEQRDLFLTDLLKRLSVFDFVTYRDLLLESSGLIPAETQEELYRLRNVRLAEKGFLPFDEAVGIYQPLSVAEFAAREQKSRRYTGRQVESYPWPVDPLQPGENANLFTRTLAQLNDPAMLQKLQAEFAGLCNRITAADQRPIREKAAMHKVVHKAGDYISMGLEKIAAAIGDRAPYGNARLLQTHLLSDIFRVGYGCALALKWKAGKWHRASWFNHEGLSIAFWGETWMGVLGGLLLKKPLFFLEDATDQRYREFATLSDIQRCETVLNDIIAFDDLFSLMNISTQPVKGYGFLTYQNVLLTLWANHYLGETSGNSSPIPITGAQLQQFHRELFQGEDPPHRISDSMRELFLGWLADRSGLADYEIAERMAPALERVFVEIENELGSVAVNDLDPRYVHLFLFNG